jgi:hypothetical protein
MENLEQFLLFFPSVKIIYQPDGWITGWNRFLAS